jgi:hypothetical protein
LEDFDWHLLAVIIGGATVLLVVRVSRKKWNSEYGEKSGKENSRFGLCLVTSYVALTLLVYVDPRLFLMLAIILAIISQVGIGPLDFFDDKPGLKKDVVYGTAISTILAAITGFFIHTS